MSVLIEDRAKMLHESIYHYERSLPLEDYEAPANNIIEHVKMCRMMRQLEVFIATGKAPDEGPVKSFLDGPDEEGLRYFMPEDWGWELEGGER